MDVVERMLISCCACRQGRALLEAPSLRELWSRLGSFGVFAVQLLDPDYISRVLESVPVSRPAPPRGNNLFTDLAEDSLPLTRSDVCYPSDQQLQSTLDMASLGPAVSSLQSSLSLLESSISILDEGVSDFPRLCKVLQTQQHFELLAEPTLREAQQSLVDEIVPAIHQLVSTAERHIDQLARKEESLKARSELLKGRLNSSRGDSSFDGSVPPSRTAESTSSASLSDTKLLEMKRLQQKKERLQYAIERLELQGKQRERELRKSMAFVSD
jgi:DASH complex subunit SPC19